MQALSPVPAVSVLIAAQPPASCIDGALDSLLGQTMPDWEAVVVAGRGVAESVARRDDPRIRLVQRPHRGVPEARNHGLEAARGEALLFLDPEGRLARDALERLVVALAEAPVAVGAAGPHAVLPEAGPPGDAMPQDAPRAHPLRIGSGDILEQLCVEPLFAGGGQLLLRRDVVRRAGPFLPGLRQGEEWEFWTRLALQGPFVVTPSPEPILLLPGRAEEGTGARMARDPSALAAPMEAIFGNPELLERLGARRLAVLRRRAEAERDWTIGAALLRQGRRRPGLARLRASVAAAPRPRRMLLLAAAHGMPLLPRALRRRFGMPAGPLR